MGRTILFIGASLILVGAVVVLFERLGVHLGKLPGDIICRKGNTTIYIPIATSIVLSILLSLIFLILRK